MTDRHQQLLRARDSLFLRWKADRILGIEEIPRASLATPKAELATPKAGSSRPQAGPTHRPPVPPLR
ncbi:MAG: hypothetical protein V2A76_04450, partial [Planctomycetota bacterium]